MRQGRYAVSAAGGACLRPKGASAVGGFRFHSFGHMVSLEAALTS